MSTTMKSSDGKSTSAKSTSAGRSGEKSTARSTSGRSTSSTSGRSASSASGRSTSSASGRSTSSSSARKKPAGSAARRRRRKSRRQQQMEQNMKFAAVIAVAVLLVFVVFRFQGCARVRHDSPKRVVRSLIQAYAKKNENMIKDCYGQKQNTEESLMQEINTTLKYIQAHNTQGIKVRKCDTLEENEYGTYVYVLYSLVLENEQEYPCLGTYMVRAQDNKYYILAPSEITDEMSESAVTAFNKFMTTDMYKDYMKEYNTFVKKNPGYEEKIAGILGE